MLATWSAASRANLAPSAPFLGRDCAAGLAVSERERGSAPVPFEPAPPAVPANELAAAAAAAAPLHALASRAEAISPLSRRSDDHEAGVDDPVSSRFRPDPVRAGCEKVIGRRGP